MESLESVMPYILSFLCGPHLKRKSKKSFQVKSLHITHRHIEDYTSNLLCCERVCKWLKSVVADDKLWGYWGVLDGSWPAVPIYGPTLSYDGESVSDIPNIHYDERFNSWREIAMWKKSLGKVSESQCSKAPDDCYTYGFQNDSSIAYTLANYVFHQKIWPDLELDSLLRVELYEPLHPMRGMFGTAVREDLEQMRRMFGTAAALELREDLVHLRDMFGTAVLELRKDSAQMLFTLVGDYLLDVIQSSHRIEIHGAEKYSHNNVVPVLGSDSMILFYSMEHNSKITDIDLSGLSREEDHQFDSLIRKIAYKGGVARLDSSGYECAKAVYCDAVFRVLNDACVEIMCDGPLQNNCEKKKISTRSDAFYVKPGMQILQSDTVVFLPVPAQFQNAMQRSIGHFTKRRQVYGVEQTTLELENLIQYYSIEDGSGAADDSESMDVEYLCPNEQHLKEEDEQELEDEELNECIDEIDTITEKIAFLLSQGRLDCQKLDKMIDSLLLVDEAASKEDSTLKHEHEMNTSH